MVKRCLGGLSEPLDPSFLERVEVLRFLDREGTFSEDMRDVVEAVRERDRERDRETERERGGVGGRMGDG